MSRGCSWFLGEARAEGGHVGVEPFYSGVCPRAVRGRAASRGVADGGQLARQTVPLTAVPFSLPGVWDTVLSFRCEQHSWPPGTWMPTWALVEFGAAVPPQVSDRLSQPASGCGPSAALWPLRQSGRCWRAARPREPLVNSYNADVTSLLENSSSLKF